MPACILNISPLRCVELPEPAESKFSAPGVALAALTTSRTDLYLLPALTTSTLGTVATSETGAKSFTVSYESLGYSVALMACPTETRISV